MKQTYYYFETFVFPDTDEEYEVEYTAESVNDSMPTEACYEEWMYPPKVCALADKKVGKALEEIVEMWKQQTT